MDKTEHVARVLYRDHADWLELPVKWSDLSKDLRDRWRAKARRLLDATDA